MGKLTVVYGRNNLPGGFAIRLFTWSRWQHVGIVTDRGTVIEATFAGVTETPTTQFLMRYRATHTGLMPCESRDKALSLAKEQIGKPYDWGALLGIVFRRSKWQHPDRWFCSELVAHCTQLFREDRVGRVTPEHCFKLTKP